MDNLTSGSASPTAAASLPSMQALSFAVSFLVSLAVLALVSGALPWASVAEVYFVYTALRVVVALLPQAVAARVYWASPKFGPGFVATVALAGTLLLCPPFRHPSWLVLALWSGLLLSRALAPVAFYLYYAGLRRHSGWPNPWVATAVFAL